MQTFHVHAFTRSNVQRRLWKIPVEERDPVEKRQRGADAQKYAEGKLGLEVLLVENNEINAGQQPEINILQPRRNA